MQCAALDRQKGLTTFLFATTSACTVDLTVTHAVRATPRINGTIIGMGSGQRPDKPQVLSYS